MGKIDAYTHKWSASFHGNACFYGYSAQVSHSSHSSLLRWIVAFLQVVKINSKKSERVKMIELDRKFVRMTDLNNQTHTMLSLNGYSVYQWTTQCLCIVWQTIFTISAVEHCFQNNSAGYNQKRKKKN